MDINIIKTKLESFYYFLKESKLSPDEKLIDMFFGELPFNYRSLLILWSFYCYDTTNASTKTGLRRVLTNQLNDLKTNRLPKVNYDQWLIGQK